MRTTGAAAALEAVRRRAADTRGEAARRWAAATGTRIDPWADGFAARGRVTLCFHPDRVARSGRTVAAGLRHEGRYRSQWVTGISSGSRSALPGGLRHGFERQLFGPAYDGAAEPPVYGALDLLSDPHGGAARFGSCYLVLRRHVLARTTLCAGDSHTGPRDVGTADAPWALLAALAEQAAAGALLERPLGVADLFEVLAGGAPTERPARSLDGYVEAQVHGGVHLARDVAAVVVDPSFAGTDVGEDLAAVAERHGLALRWHPGSELAAADVPAAMRGEAVVALAERCARADGRVDAAAIGRAARTIGPEPARPGGDPESSPLQVVKYLWHVVFALGHDASTPASGAPGVP